MKLSGTSSVLRICMEWIQTEERCLAYLLHLRFWKKFGEVDIIFKLILNTIVANVLNKTYTK